MKPVQTFFGIPPPLRTVNETTATDSPPSIAAITQLPDTWTLEATVPPGITFASTTPFTSHQLRQPEVRMERPTTRSMSTTDRTVQTLPKPRRRQFPRFFAKNTTRENHGIAESMPAFVRQHQDDKPSDLAIAIERALKDMDPKSPMAKVMPEISALFGLPRGHSSENGHNKAFSGGVHTSVEHNACRKSELQHLTVFGSNLMRLIAFLVNTKNQTVTPQTI
ncbi:hypothetical protein RvY_05994 [Ramazzottius varieornatus]|uniref:Uncharacterized protein n=1 Tax=Ramazzottius varieornatus TaxID=947166 RepID=A0A1D1UWY7_RAMVA|nr:hypothetical protein RvY_05994 [Ramazzottius varieornatus]